MTDRMNIRNRITPSDTDAPTDKELSDLLDFSAMFSPPTSKGYDPVCASGRRKEKPNAHDLRHSAYSQLHPISPVFGVSSSDFSHTSDYGSLATFIEACPSTSEDSARLETETEFRDLHMDHSIGDAEVFVPDILENASQIRTNNSYRFQCPHAGQYQCKFTSLVFEMEGKGEVLYRIDSWDTRLLDGLGQMQPAGPLYNIDCIEGSVSRLHLPHCEMLTGGNQAELMVAHFTGDNIEIIQPLKMTDTHVIIGVESLSLFGLLKKIVFYTSPISAQVLLFYEEIIGKQSKNKLLIHLLPRNVPVEEVEKRRKGSIYFETSSTCQLTPGSKYRPSCDPYISQPKVAKFECDYGPNYHPTFVVFFEAEEITVSLLDEDGTEVWEAHQIFPSGHQTDAALLKSMKGAEFVDEHREKLIQSVSCVMELADSLQSQKMITKEMYSNIKVAKTSQERMRILYEILQSAGRAVKAEFFQVLKEKQPFLVDELESGPRKA